MITKEEWLSVPYLLYYAHAITSWGNRMWRFSIGLFLVNISKSLRLTAIYGFTSSFTILVFGAAIGHWIDKNQRFKVAKLAIFGQNSLLTVCALLFALSFTVKYWFKSTTRQHENTAQNFLMFGIIFTAILADIASLISRIVIDTDWVAVIALDQKRNLAGMNAILKRIDLLCNILTPLLVGQILYLVNLITGAFIVAGWNILSAFLEYALLRKIYLTVPRLAVKSDRAFLELTAENQYPTTTEKVETTVVLVKHKENTTIPQNYLINNISPNSTKGDHDDDDKNEAHDMIDTIVKSAIDESYDTVKPLLAKSVGAEREAKYEREGHEDQINDKKTQESEISIIYKNNVRFANMKNQVTKQIRMFLDGWKLYLGQKIKYVGLSYSFLYLTVLGFDSITVGYAYSLKVSEAIIGTMIALGAITGIFGTFLYPRLWNRFGSVKTGIISLISQILCIVFCVVSLWLPGTPWEPVRYLFTHDHEQRENLLNPSINNNRSIRSRAANLETLMPLSSKADLHQSKELLLTNISRSHLQYKVVDNMPSFDPEIVDIAPVPYYSSRDIFLLNQSIIKKDEASLYNSNSSSRKSRDDAKFVVLPSDNSNTNNVTRNDSLRTFKYAHIGVFLFGIVASRTGLWMIDLTINQIIQESIVESQKGVISGVQRSLTMIFEILKYGAVILLPKPETFGWLVLVSFAAIIASLACFLVYAFQNVHSQLKLQDGDEGVSRINPRSFMKSHNNKPTKKAFVNNTCDTSYRDDSMNSSTITQTLRQSKNSFKKLLPSPRDKSEVKSTAARKEILKNGGENKENPLEDSNVQPVYNTKMTTPIK